jgi:hypothetical protein
MTSADDEYGKRVLAPLEAAPPIDPQIAASEKARFLIQGDELRVGYVPRTGSVDRQRDHGISTRLLRKPNLSLLKGLVAALIVLIILIGSSLTVYAAQDRLPGESLYPLKVISEDIRLSLTHSPQAKLDMTLNFTNRRVDEITQCLETGNPLPVLASDRLQGELESALQLAAQMEDKQMQNALSEIKGHAESQGMTIEELITQLPEQAEPAMVHLQERLREQVTLSTIGENDPQTYRLEVRERQRRHSGIHNPTSTNNDNASTPAGSSSTPLPTEAGEDLENGMEQPTLPHGHGETNPGQDNPNSGNGNHGPDNPNPGNGNHGPNQSHTPKP